MNRQTTILRSVHIALCPKEDRALQTYLDQNGIKFKSWLKILILKELEEKKVINSADFTMPKISDCLIKSKR